MNKKTPIQLTNKIIQNYKNNKIAKKSLRIIIATIALIQKRITKIKSIKTNTKMKNFLNQKNNR